MTGQYQPSLRSWFGANAEQRIENRRFLFSFHGRVPRGAYWRFAFVPPNLFFGLALWFDLPARMGTFGFMICSLAIAWVALAVAVKRCHDRGRSGWFLLVALIPVAGYIWTIVELGFGPGTTGDNQYGAGSSG